MPASNAAHAEPLKNAARFQPAEKHRNGVEWVFWAEEPETDGE